MTTTACRRDDGAGTPPAEGGDVATTVTTSIVKSPADLPVIPNLLHYDEGASSPGFWERARAELDGLPGGTGLNIAHEAVDRHAAGARAEHLALRWLGKHGEVARLHLRRARPRDEPLRERARRASASERATSSARSPGASRSSTSRALGTLKNRSVFSPLFSAFGPEPIRTRLALGNAKALVTTELLYERKVAALRDVAARSSST